MYTYILLLPDSSNFQYYYGLSITSGRPPRCLVSFLFFGLMLCSSVVSSLAHYFLSVTFLSLFLFSSNSILGLLSLLIYLGSLIVLFAYLWIFMTRSHYSFLFSSSFFYSFCCYFLLLPSSPSSTLSFLLPTSYLLFVVSLLFWVILVVVTILDLSLGGFSA